METNAINIALSLTHKSSQFIIHNFTSFACSDTGQMPALVEIINFKNSVLLMSISGQRNFVIRTTANFQTLQKCPLPSFRTGLPDFFGTTYQIGKNIPTNYKIYLMATKYTKWQ
jgi:hypothetical protein